jgi:hypothetical protein
MAYDLTVRQGGEIQLVSGDGTREAYTLAAAPGDESFLVQTARKQVLQTINLEQMFKNLDSGVTLLDITYNAVNGMEGGLSPKVAKLQSEFLNTLSDSLVVTQGFEAGTKATVADLIRAYKYLIDPKYTKLPKASNGIALAYKVFLGVKAKAGMMRKDAEGLAKNFGKLRDAAVGANQLIIGQKNLDYKTQQEMLAEMNKMQAQIDGLKLVKDDLDTEISAYESEYKSVSTQAEKEASRAFSLALTSAIMGGLSSMIGSIIPCGDKKKDSGSADSGTASGASGRAGKDSGVAEKAAESEKKESAIREKIAANEKKIAEIKEQQKTAKGDEAQKELMDKLNAETRDKQKNETDLAAAKSQSEVYKQALGGLGEGLSFTSKKFDDMSQKSDDRAQSLYARLDKIADQKAAVAKERRQAIQQLATFTKSIEHASTEEADLELAITALITAVGCMRLVEVYLSDIALFWRNVENFCQQLIDEMQKINEHTEAFIEIENYCEFFTDEDFVLMYLLNMSSWVALHSICVEYLDAFNSAYTKQKEAIGNPEMDRKEHWKRSRELAKSMSGVFEQQLTEGIE